jgi:hypothetical protein
MTNTTAPAPTLDNRTRSVGGTYHHTTECDMFTLGSAVAVLLEGDFPLTIENLHNASIGTRDVFPHRPCYGNCAALRLGAIETSLEHLRRQVRAGQRSGATSSALALANERIAELVAERAAIREEVDA